jgi:hypothetical protein
MYRDRFNVKVPQCLIDSRLLSVYNSYNHFYHFQNELYFWL